MGSAVCKCVVCHEDYLACGDRAPQVLRCGRSICGQCVGQLIDHHPHGRRAAICPKCRKETAETDVSPNHDMRELLAFLAPTGSLTWAAQWLGYTLVWMPLRVGISLLGHADTEEMYYVLCVHIMVNYVYILDTHTYVTSVRVFVCVRMSVCVCAAERRHGQREESVCLSVCLSVCPSVCHGECG